MKYARAHLWFCSKFRSPFSNELENRLAFLVVEYQPLNSNMPKHRRDMITQNQSSSHCFIDCQMVVYK